jgi:DtxR family Mn-dependent transcriptional regulator
MVVKKTKTAAPSQALSTAQEDYLETIHKLSGDTGSVRITDIAERLGVRLPPVTRAVQGLEKLGFVERQERREVRLTESGRRRAEALVHRHADLVYLLTEVLGVPKRAAEQDTCQMEHGISAVTAQRLHEFLEHFKSLDEEARSLFRADAASAAFRFLPGGKSSGWRA